MSWRKLKAEYIAGGISQRKLADKYNVPFGTLQKRARAEKWNSKRIKADDKAVEKVIQKTVEIVADNATLCEQIKTNILRKLAKMVEAYPDTGAAEIKKKQNGELLTYRMKDLAAVYESLSDKMPKGQNVDIEDLSPLVELLKGE